MTAAERIAALEARLERVEGLVCHCQQVKGILGGERAAREQQARIAHLRAFESAPSPEARLELFAASTDAEKGHLITTISPERWAAFVAEADPADRRVYLDAMKRTSAGSSLIRFVSFEVAAPPDIVQVELTAERSVSVDLRPGVELRRGCPIKMYRSRWVEEFENAKPYGERLVKMQAAGDLSVAPADPQVARSFARSDVDYPTPSIG